METFQRNGHSTNRNGNAACLDTSSEAAVGWLFAAKADFEASHGKQDGVLTVTVRAVNSGAETTYAIPANHGNGYHDGVARGVPPQAAAKTLDCVAVPPAPIRAIERRILECVGRDPIPAKQLARMSGYRTNSHFRGALAALTRAGLLRHTPEGYAVASLPPTVPPAPQ
jgi:hypothetical protein